MYRERIIDPTNVAEAAGDAARLAYPLGCYASASTIRYLFLQREGVLGLATVLQNGGSLLSLTGAQPLYDWHEREMRQLQGIRVEGHPDARPLYFDAESIPEAVIAEGKGVVAVVVGPVHAGIIEPGRFTISTGGESVVHLDAQLSYSHRGIERFFEGRDPMTLSWHVSRICANCTVARSIAYARCVETLADVRVDEAGELVRLIFAEIERLHVHLFDLGSASAGAGYGRGTTTALRLREQINRIAEEHGGSRVLFDIIQPGGIRSGALSDPRALRSQLRALRGDVERFLKELFGKRSVVHRFKGAGIISEPLARRYGAVGPSARACGIALDVRSHAPYGAYRDIAVESVVGRDGDVYARCEIRRREIAASFDLLERAFERLGERPPGAPQVLVPREGVVTCAVEGARGAESISLEVDSDGRVARLHVISAAYRNWPLVARAMEDNIVPDFPLVNKSFNLCYSCVDR